MKSTTIKGTGKSKTKHVENWQAFKLMNFQIEVSWLEEIFSKIIIVL